MFDILVAEDDVHLNRIYCSALQDADFHTFAAYNGEEAMELIAEHPMDLVISDIMMPGIDGYTLTKHLRNEFPEMPILMISAKEAYQDKRDGFLAGIDDYMVKPFDFDELMARIRAITRRKTGRAENTLRSGDLVMDRNARQVFRGDIEISLTSKEFEILEFMMQNPGTVLSRDKLSSHVWNYEYDGGSNVIDVYMHHLRKKIDGDFEEKKLVTVKGAGYKLV